MTLMKPNDRAVTNLLRNSELANFTYDQIGATRRDQAPRGFDLDCVSAPLGYGETAFTAAIAAFSEWRMFPSEMATVLTPSAAIRVGEIVAIQFKTLIAWSVCPSRVIYTINERKPCDGIHRFGFGYGTLPGHVERGEEQFLLQWDRATDEVSYSIKAFSRPASLLVRIGYPYARLQQARFRRLSVRAMQRSTPDCRPRATVNSADSPSGERQKQSKRETVAR